MYKKYGYAAPEKRLYKATFEGLPNDNKMFRAWNDFKAMVRADKIAVENGYGDVKNIYELDPGNRKIIRSALNCKIRRA